MEEIITTHNPKRLDTSFGSSEREVTRVLELEQFQDPDTDSFPLNRLLEKIVDSYTRLVEYKKGDVIVRVGDYGNSVYYVVSGEVGVVMPPGLPKKMLDRSERRKRGIFFSLISCFKSVLLPEVRLQSEFHSGEDIGSCVNGEVTRDYLKDFNSIFSKYLVKRMGLGKMFGVMSTLARIPRTVTIFATENVELLEIRWQALREIRRYDDEFRSYVDTLYRKRSLIIHLRKILHFARLDDADLEQIARHTSFKSYGSFGWSGSYNREKAKSDKYSSLAEIPIVSQGDDLDSLLIISSGLSNVTIQVSHGNKSICILGNGEIFGFEEIFYNWKHGKSVSFQAGLWALGYVDVLRVPTSIIEELVLPKLPAEFIDHMDRKANSWIEESPASIVKADVDSGLMEFLIYHRYINGTQTMMIDLDRCTHCDECVHACAKGHNGNPRFIRHGFKYSNIMVSNACMHCVDPVCLIDCPTGAIYRTEQDGTVVINDNTCIGCKICAKSCPYDNIRMVETMTDDGAVVTNESTYKPILKATKCDLCIDLPGGPACQRACPHDALIRIDTKNQSALNKWVNRS
ncbi:MAG: 4Fe-4S dicluster domain-containing protein [Candidatus Scalindua sp.]|nr:4Fe-4S dicluster domain-containing protein [Candidatus Scalindua sp.]